MTCLLVFILSDKLNATSIIEITKILSKFPKVTEVCKLFEDFHKEMKKTSKSTEGVNASVQPSPQMKYRLFDGLYAWHCYTRSKSKSELAKFLLSKNYTEEALKIYPFRKFGTVTVLVKSKKIK